MDTSAGILTKDTLEKLLIIGEKFESLITEKPEDVLREIVVDACNVIRADCAVVYPYDYRRQDFYDIDSVVAWGLTQNFNLTDKPRSKGGMAAYVSREREIIYNDIAHEAPELLASSPFIKRENIRAFIGTALKAGNDVLGILYIDFRTPHEFTPEEIETVHLFAHQAAFAISNSQLNQQVKTRADIQQKLSLVAAEMVRLSEGTADLNKLLLQIANGAKEVLDVDLVDLYQYYQSRDYYPTPVIMVGERFQPVEKIKIYPDDVVCTVVRRGTPWYVPNVKEEPELHRGYEGRMNVPPKRFVEREEIQSMAAIPIKTGNEVVGVLFASYRKAQPFGTTYKELVELFSAQAAIAIRNARLLIRRKALVEFGNILATKVNLTEREILEMIHKGAEDLMDTRNMYIALYDELSDVARFGLAYSAGQRINVETDPSWKPRNVGTRGDRVDTNKEGIGKTEFIIRTKGPIFHSTQAESEGWYKQTGHHEYVGKVSPSWIGIPMLVGDRVLGVIAMFQDRENAYSMDDLASLQTIGNQSATALDNARSYVKIGKNLMAILEFGKVISAHGHLKEQDILDLIRSQVSVLMNTENMFIAFYDEPTQIIRFGFYFENGVPKEIETRTADFNTRGLTEEIISTRRPIIFSTRQAVDNWYKEPGHKEFIGKVHASWLGVPILIGQKILGVISVNNLEKEFLYGGDDLFILQAIANQSAIALDNAHRYFDVETKLRALIDFGQKVTTSIGLSENQILEQIRTEAAHFLDADDLYIALCDYDKKMVRFPTIYRSGRPIQWLDRPMEVGRTGEIIRTRKPLFLPTRKDVENWYASHPGEEEKEPRASWLGVPMLMGDKVIGTIGVDHPDKEQHYSGDDRDILQALASLAAIAIENSRLYNLAREDVITMKRLSTLGQALASIEHRINNTLNIIIPNLERLRKRVDGNDPVIKEILDIMQRNTGYTAQLLKKIQEPLQEVSFVDVDINAILAEVFDKQVVEWKSNRTHLFVETTLIQGENIPISRLPVGQITEVFRNLMENAFRALQKSYQDQYKSGASLEVTSHCEGDTICVRVIDNVPGGIPPAIQSRLFAKPVPPKTPDEGTGLGLWLNKLAMNSFGGDVRIEKSGLLGTTMLVEIPVPG